MARLNLMKRNYVLGLVLIVVMLTACDAQGASTGPFSMVLALSGHSLWVTSVAWSPNGTYLASASFDTTVRIWDARNGSTTEVLTGYKGSVDSVAWSPDGRFLATGSSEPGDTARVWDVSSHQFIRKWLPVPRDGVSSLAWSPDSKLLATGDGELVVFDVAASKQLTRLVRYGDATSVKWSPDGRYLAFGSMLESSQSDPYVVTIWDPALGDGSENDPDVITLAGYQDFLTAVSWSPDSKKLAAGSADGALKVWGLTTKKSLLSLAGHKEKIDSVDWSPDGTMIASASEDDTAAIWNAANGAKLATLQHPNYVRAVAWSRDGKYIATACDDGKVRIWTVH